MASLLEDILLTKAASPEILAIFKDPRNYTALIVDEPARYTSSKNPIKSTGINALNLKT